jgi:hypothetical protein
MSNRETALRKLAIGDIFHATDAHEASLICLVISLTDGKIDAKTVTTQIHIRFDLGTGRGFWGPESELCWIDSITRLPEEIYQSLRNLDRRYQVGGDPRLREDEKRALVFVDTFYAENPL